MSQALGRGLGAETELATSRAQWRFSPLSPVPSQGHRQEFWKGQALGMGLHPWSPDAGESIGTRKGCGVTEEPHLFLVASVT